MSQISRITRYSDIDVNRHVTSRTYEHFASDARYEILVQNGITLNEYYDKNIRLHTKNSFVKFIRQQGPLDTINVNTRTFAFGNNSYLFDHQFEQPDGSPVCHLQVLAELNNAEIQTSENLQNEFEVHIKELDDFSGKCERIENNLVPLYSDRDAFGEYNLNSFWKFFEDGRWMFSKKLDLTLEKMLEHDTTSFYMSGHCEIFNQPVAGEPMKLFTWIDRIDKIRYYFRQDLQQGEVKIASMIDEQLVVSLSRARPQKVPQYLRDVLQPFTEH